MRRPRAKLWMVMVAVAVVAIAFPTTSWLVEVNRKAEFYRVMGRYYRTVVTAPGATPEYRQRFASWRSTMILKYERAARYPWLPVEPDTPPPR